MPVRRSTRPKSVEEYFDGIPQPQRAAMDRVRSIVQKAAPRAAEVISYGMPAFRQDGMVVYYAAFDDHCSLFVASAAVREQFARELRPYAHGKGTLRFTPKHPIPARLLIRMVKFRLKENAQRRATRPPKRTA